MILQLRKMRKAKKLSQAELADMLGANIRTVGAWERGENMMSIEQLCNCCEILGCTPNDMTGWYLEHPCDAATREDPAREELLMCYDGSNAENRDFMLQAARHAALASGEAPERNDVQDEAATA